MDITLQKTRRFPFRAGAFARFLARLLLAGVFATAATAKLHNFSQLERTLDASRLVPNGFSQILGQGLIAFELVTALGLVVPFLQPVLQKTSLWSAMFLSATFLSYSVWRGMQHIAAPCSCFGALFTMTPLQSMLINAGLLALIAALMIYADVPVQRSPARRRV